MAQIPTLKTDKRYKDAPRYKLIYDYENEFKKAHKDNVNKMLELIGKKLSEFA